MILLLLIIFIAGYVLITLEHTIHINKAAIALITAVICWTILVLNPTSKDASLESLGHHLSSIAEIVFFLLGAMTIVELIDAHDGFQNITEKIKTTNKTKFIWTISIITFFLSAVLDNLTSTIVMISIINKLVKEKTVKWQLLGLVIISSNAGGAWSPIGDVTTTMLWIGQQVTPLNIIKETFLASLTCMIVPTLIISYRIKGKIELFENSATNLNALSSAFDRNLVFFIGIACLLFVPFFKSITHLPIVLKDFLGEDPLVDELHLYPSATSTVVPFLSLLNVLPADIGLNDQSREMTEAEISLLVRKTKMPIVQIDLRKDQISVISKQAQRDLLLGYPIFVLRDDIPISLLVRDTENPKILAENDIPAKLVSIIKGSTKLFIKMGA
jgi:hypothetical protein